jgi:autoinducer 2-degrading protein
MANISFIARMTVKPGQEEDFIGLCKRLRAQVRAHEPGTVYYEFFRLREPRRYAVFESFADHEAEERHMHSAWLAEIAPPLLACLEGDPPYVREFLDPLD